MWEAIKQALRSFSKQPSAQGSDWALSKVIEDHILANCVLRLPGSKLGNASPDLRNHLRRTLRSASEEGLLISMKMWKK